MQDSTIKFKLSDYQEIKQYLDNYKEAENISNEYEDSNNYYKITKSELEEILLYIDPTAPIAENIRKVIAKMENSFHQVDEDKIAANSVLGLNDVIEMLEFHFNSISFNNDSEESSKEKNLDNENVKYQLHAPNNISKKKMSYYLEDLAQDILIKDAFREVTETDKDTVLKRYYKFRKIFLFKGLDNNKKDKINDLIRKEAKNKKNDEDKDFYGEDVKKLNEEKGKNIRI